MVFIRVVPRQGMPCPYDVVCAYDGEIVYIVTAHWMDPEKLNARKASGTVKFWCMAIWCIAIEEEAG